MVVRPVLRLGDPRLRLRSAELEAADFGSARLMALVDDLRDTMSASAGVGLAEGVTIGVGVVEGVGDTLGVGVGFADGVTIGVESDDINCFTTIGT